MSGNKMRPMTAMSALHKKKNDQVDLKSQIQSISAVGKQKAIGKFFQPSKVKSGTNAMEIYANTQIKTKKQKRPKVD